MTDALALLGVLHDTRAALGAALSTEQQIFVSVHWPELAAWLRTDSGREAARLVVDEWRASVRPAPP